MGLQMKWLVVGIWPKTDNSDVGGQEGSTVKKLRAFITHKVY